MAETISLMDKSLTSTVKRYKKEKSIVSGKSASSLEYLAEAAKKVQLNDTSLSAIDQTLQVVNQGKHLLVIIFENKLLCTALILRWCLYIASIYKRP